MLQQSPMYSYIPVADLSRARKFYEEKLGFRPKGEVSGGMIYEFGDHTACFMYPTSNAGTSKASQAFWQVNDLEREVEELKARGLTFEEYDMPNMTATRGIYSGGGSKAARSKIVKVTY